MNTIRLTRGLGRTTRSLLPRLYVEPIRGMQRVPTAPPPNAVDLDWARLDPIKPPLYKQFEDDRGGGGGGGGRKDDIPDPEEVEKDFSGCNLALNLAILKAAKKIADKVEERNQQGKPVTTADRAELNHELQQDFRKAQEDYRRCLETGKSAATALSEEAFKYANETVENQLTSLHKSIIGLE